MAAQPTDADIEMMVSLTQVSRSEAIARLKGNNNDVSQAMNEYFDNPESTSYTWDESQFSSDRDGSNNKSGISFQVQGPDDHGSGGYLSGAPSRPPSRTSNKSPMGKTLSMGERHPDGRSDRLLASNEFQDPDLEKALAESRQSAGLPPQEYGVTSTNVVHFGPATRETYEQSQWQMVHVPNGSNQGLLGNPKAENRKRKDGTPAFLKPSTDDHRLASLLTIYHEIPLCREIFLHREDLLPDFGYDSEWWAGKVIASPRDFRRSSSGERDVKQIYHELQRLTAFLDKTERSYGSVEPLTKLDIIQNAPPDDVESKFFEAWKYAQRGSSTLGSIYSAAVQPDDNMSADQVEIDSSEFAILDLYLPNVDDSGELQTLYDLIDRALWMRSGLEISNSAYMTHVADVIGFRLIGSDSSRVVTIPELWFPDRYLESGRESALQMRKCQEEVKQSMREVFRLENMLKFFTLSSGRTVKVRDLLDVSLLHDAEPSLDDPANGVKFDALENDMNSEPRVQDKFDVSAELQNVIASIDSKLKGGYFGIKVVENLLISWLVLDEEKRKALTSLQELSNLDTHPPNKSKHSLLHKYKLCGVSTTKEIIYLRKQAEPDLIDMDLDGTEPNMNSDEWWKIQYTAADEKPVNISKVLLEDVIVAATTESKNTIVVYANEKAMAEPIKPLPDALEAFVRADNLAFSAEFPHEQGSQSPVPSPVSPGKRKYDERAEDAQDRPPRYTEQPRWGGKSPIRDNGVIVSHRELDESDDGGSAGNGWGTTSYDSNGESITPQRDHSYDVIMGQDPAELAGLNFPSLVNSASQQTVQEMQEKRGMPTILGNAMDDKIQPPNRTDSMDVDEIAFDGTQVDSQHVLAGKDAVDST